MQVRPNPTRLRERNAARGGELRRALAEGLTRLVFAARFERLRERHVVGELELRPDGKALGEPGYLDPERPEEAGEIDGRRFALDIGARREDDLTDPAAPDTVHEGTDAQLLRTDAPEGRERATENVIPAPEQPRPLDRREIRGLLH